jgi:1-acyl-sn-glycerol-3-phosphate acyltransferase
VLRSAWAWLSITVLIIVWIPVMAITHLLDRKDPGKYATGRQFRRLGYLMAAANPAWSIQISGSYPESMRNPYVVVCNHQSLADIPIVSRLPWDMKWVGKASLFKLPVLGWMMRVAGDIPVSRGDRRSRAQVMIDTKERLQQKVSVMIMPEGTRSPDGRVGEFNDGAFKLALKLGIPVLTIAIDGSFDALPKNGWMFGEGSPIHLHVFDPILPEEWIEDGTALCEHVRKLIVDQIAEWRGVDPGEVDSLAMISA